MPSGRKTVEDVKQNWDSFGGFQKDRLPSGDIEMRMCAARGCGKSGKVQIMIPGGYRILCARDAVLHCLITAAMLGDPTPASEAREYARALGVDWDDFLRTAEPKQPTTPEHFVCVHCGGKMEADPREWPTYEASKRYIHNCL